jgi:hypothetical protein
MKIGKDDDLPLESSGKLEAGLEAIVAKEERVVKSNDLETEKRCKDQDDPRCNAVLVTPLHVLDVFPGDAAFETDDSCNVQDDVGDTRNSRDVGVLVRRVEKAESGQRELRNKLYRAAKNH